MDANDADRLKALINARMRGDKATETAARAELNAKLAARISAKAEWLSANVQNDNA